MLTYAKYFDLVNFIWCELVGFSINCYFSHFYIFITWALITYNDVILDHLGCHFCSLAVCLHMHTIAEHRMGPPRLPSISKDSVHRPLTGLLT